MSPDRRVVSVVVLAALLSASVGYILGESRGRAELEHLVSLPAGGVHFSATTRAVWTKRDGRTLIFAAYPTDPETKLLRRFPWFNAPPVTESASSTTTLPPAAPAKEKRP